MSPMNHTGDDLHQGHTVEELNAAPPIVEREALNTPHRQSIAPQTTTGLQVPRSTQYASTIITLLRERPWWRGLVFLLVLGGGLWGYYGMYADPPIVTTSDSPLTAPATQPYQVVYEVHGTSRDVSLRYRTDAGMIEHQHVPLPFRAEITMDPGSMLLISVDNYDLPSTLYCKIYVDEEFFASSTRSAVDEKAYCSGRR